jgi:uncharacterized membrane protein YeaQ/YmgE (transglycosylase-associated protein family)
MVWQVRGDRSAFTVGDAMGIIGWIVLGLLAGAIAKAILPGPDPGGIIVTLIIGIVGALLGGFLAQGCSTATRSMSSST